MAVLVSSQFCQTKDRFFFFFLMQNAKSEKTYLKYCQVAIWRHIFTAIISRKMSKQVRVRVSYWNHIKEKEETSVKVRVRVSYCNHIKEKNKKQVSKLTRDTGINSEQVPSRTDTSLPTKLLLGMQHSECQHTTMWERESFACQQHTYCHDSIDCGIRPRIWFGAAPHYLHSMGKDDVALSQYASKLNAVISTLYAVIDYFVVSWTGLLAICPTGVKNNNKCNLNKWFFL